MSDVFCFFSINFPSLQLTGSPQVGEQLDNVIGHWWGDGQVSSAWLESVLIGNPVDGDGDSIMDVRVATPGNWAGIFLCDLFLGSALLDLGSILALEANVYRWI